MVNKTDKTSAMTLVENPDFDDLVVTFEASMIPLYRPKHIYIAGPMRGYENYNFPAFYEADDRLTELGWIVGNPARMDDETGGADQYTVMPGTQGVRLAMQRDLVWIAKHADAIYMLRGWENSSGANAEWTLAKMLGLEIYYQETL